MKERLKALIASGTPFAFDGKMLRALTGGFTRILAVDFDSTCVHKTEDECQVGVQVENAVSVLTELTRSGDVRLILYTCRDGEGLVNAQKWFDEQGIPLWGVNMNPDQLSWSGSRKIYADLYIDNRNLGVPLKLEPGFDDEVVDWSAVRTMLSGMGWL